MKVCIVRGGGIAGLATRAELSAADLDEEGARELRHRVEAARIAAEGRGERPGRSRRPWPDAQLYEVVVEDGGREVRGRYTDADMPTEVEDLIAWVDTRPERSVGRAT